MYVSGSNSQFNVKINPNVKVVNVLKLFKGK